MADPPQPLRCSRVVLPVPPRPLRALPPPGEAHAEGRAGEEHHEAYGEQGPAEGPGGERHLGDRAL